MTGFAHAEFVLLGTGVSTALPQIGCILPNAKHHCPVCLDGLNNQLSPNRRCNASALVRLGEQTVLIDCGKTIREASLRHFRKLGVGGVDAIVITHGHFDAMGGIDDVRDIQKRDEGPTPIFLNEETYETCSRVYPYLMSKPEDGVERRVASIDWNLVPHEFEKFYPIADTEIAFSPVPLFHGGEYICWGFVIEVADKIIAYLSDVKKVPERTMEFLKSLPHIDVLVIDALSHKEHPTHFNLSEAKELALELRPSITRCTGMGCRLGLHDEVNAQLLEEQKQTGLDFLLGHDGLRIKLA